MKRRLTIFDRDINSFLSSVREIAESEMEDYELYKDEPDEVLFKSKEFRRTFTDIVMDILTGARTVTDDTKEALEELLEEVKDFIYHIEEISLEDSGLITINIGDDDGDI